MLQNLPGLRLLHGRKHPEMFSRRARSLSRDTRASDGKSWEPEQSLRCYNPDLAVTRYCALRFRSDPKCYRSRGACGIGIGASPAGLATGGAAGSERCTGVASVSWLSPAEWDLS